MAEMLQVQAKFSLKEKTFDFQPLYSGGVLWINGFSSGVVLDLEGLEGLPEKVPCCFDHNGFNIVGEIRPEKKIVDGKPQIFATGHFLDTAAALKILQEYRGKNTKWQCSIGTERFDRVYDVDYIHPKQRVRVNERDFVGPLAVVRRWSLEEGSFVRKGGDARNAAVIHARAVDTKGLVVMDEELKKFIEEAGYDPETLTLDQKCIFEKSFALAQKRLEESKAEAEEPTEEPTEKPADESTEAEAEGAEETENPSTSSTEGSQESEGGEKEKAEVCSCGKCKAKVRASGLNSRAARMAPGRVTASAGSPDPQDVYAVAILRNLGMQEAQVKAAGYSENAMCEGLAKKFNGFSVKAMAMEMIRQATGNIYQGTEDAFVNAFFHPQSVAVRANAFSTQNPLGILSNVLNVVYLQGVQHVDDVVSKISKRQDVKNFHDAKFSQYEIYGLPEDTAPNGRLKHATIVGEDYDISMARSGNRLTLDRDMLINDQVEAFVDLVMKQGIKHQRKRQQRGMTKLMDALTGDDTFSSANGNKITKALCIDGLDLAAAALRVQSPLGSDPDEKEALELEGKYLLVPPQLAGTAAKLFQETNIVASTESQTMVYTNTYYKYQPVVSSYISSGFHTNGSNSGWFLLADPQELPILGETRLQGAAEPHITPVPPPDGIIGASWATFFEYGFGILDHRAAVYSTGTT